MRTKEWKCQYYLSKKDYERGEYPMETIFIENDHESKVKTIAHDYQKSHDYGYCKISYYRTIERK